MHEVQRRGASDVLDIERSDEVRLIFSIDDLFEKAKPCPPTMLRLFGDLLPFIAWFKLGGFILLLFIINIL